MTKIELTEDEIYSILCHIDDSRHCDAGDDELIKKLSDIYEAIRQKEDQNEG